MPVIDMGGLNTQAAPVDAIECVLEDFEAGHITGSEFAVIVRDIITEWRL